MRRRDKGAFDPAFYLAGNPDVTTAGLDPATQYRIGGDDDVLQAGLDPAKHYVASRRNEPRRPNPYFDPAWYVATRQATWGERQARLSPVAHYILDGEARGQRPILRFDPAWYAAEYGLPAGTSALAHYLAHRGKQIFSPLPMFDVGFYMDCYGLEIRPPIASATCWALGEARKAFFFEKKKQKTFMTQERLPLLKESFLVFFAKKNAFLSYFAAAHSWL